VISTDINRAEFNGDASATAFVFRTSGGTDIPVKDVSHIKVYVGAVLKTLTTHYTVGFVGTTATITFTVGNVPPSGTANILFIRDVPFTQDTDLANNSQLDAESLESQLDLMVNQSQQINDNTSRNLRFSDTLTAVNATETHSTLNVTSALRANKSLKFDATGNLAVTTIDTDKAEDYILEAKSYATQTPAVVNHYSAGVASPQTNVYSSLEHAVGSPPDGSAKEWATTDTVAVTGSLYSAKQYAANAAISETSANASADAVAVMYDAFNDKYLGSMLDTATQGTNPTPTGQWTKNSSTITVSANTNIKVGQIVVGAGIETSPVPNVISIDGTAIVISDNMAAVSASSTVALTFTGHGIYGTFDGTKDGPALDNDGVALADGALYFNTTDDVLKVYDTTSSTWKNLTPSSAEQTNINAAVADAVDIGKVAAIDTEIGQLAVLGTAGVDISTVAGIGTAGADVTTVANITAGDISKVAIITTGDVSKVADITTGDVSKVAVITTGDVSKVAVITTGDVSKVAAITTGDVSKVGVITTGDVSKVADVDTEIALLGTSAMAHATTGNLTKLGAGYDGTATLSGTNTNLTQVNTVANNITTVNDFANRYRVAANADLPLPNLDAGDLYFNTNTNELNVYNATTSLWQQATPNQGDIDAINIVAGNIIYQEDLGSIATAVTTSTVTNEIGKVAALEDEIERLGTVPMATATTGSIALLGTTAMTDTSTGYLKVLGNATVTDDLAILGSTTVTDDMALLAVPAVITDMDLLGASGVIGDIETVADSIGNVNRYANEYVISSSTPTSPTPTAGDLWYDSSTNEMKYHNGTAFAVITTGMTSLIADVTPELGGALDANNNNFTEVGTISGDNLQIDFGTLP
jgi:hypothetical protein